MRIQQIYPWLALPLLAAVFSGCATGGVRGMDTLVADMHKRVTLLDEELEPSLAQLNENAAALIQRVNENERQIRLLTSLVEENQHKLDKLIQMLADLKTTLYRHWGISTAPVGSGGPSAGSGVQIVPPSSRPDAGSASTRNARDAAAPPVTPPPSTDKSVADYIAAKEQYEQEDYEGAASAFSRYLDAYPNASEAHKAQFWLGKSYLNQSQYSRAIREFEVLRRDYPDSSYMPFALHNQAVGHYKLGERNKAIALMEEVVANYPTSTASKHAARDLEQIRGRQ